MVVQRRGPAASVIWPIAAGLIALAAAVAFPPAFWVSILGAILLAVAVTLNSNRTGEWSYLPWRATTRTDMTCGETTLGLTAATLVAVPLLVAIVRSLVR
jgi:hypothetical protein